MSLVRIAAAKNKKRRFADGGGESEYSGPADSGETGGGANAPESGGNIGGSGSSYSGPADSGETGGGANAPETGGNIGGSGPGTGNIDGSGQGTEYGVPGPSTGVYGGSVQYNGETIQGGAQRTGLGDLMDKLSNMSPAQRAGLASLPGGGLATAGLGLAEKMGLGWSGGNNVGSGSGTNGDIGGNGDRRPGDGPADAAPFGSSTPTQTTTIGAGGDAGPRKYVWDPIARQYTLFSVGAGANPMGYSKGQTFQMAAGGMAPTGIAAGAPTGPRFVQGGGTGLSDDVPVKMDDGGEGRLADGEFVIPADVVSGLGGGSSKAGADILYQMMERIRQQAHGSKQQIRPVDPQQVMPA